METKSPNQSIGCSVTSCRYHCGDKQYCSLDKIQVGTHEKHPKQEECTDCQSFDKRAY
ncbi:MAG: DUF1540 domain-containing protein [Clostridiales bacterium]|nr:DUF1540 domain-containing protein [Clostridiales bacterium]